METVEMSARSFSPDCVGHKTRHQRAPHGVSDIDCSCSNTRTCSGSADKVSKPRQAEFSLSAFCGRSFQYSQINSLRTNAAFHRANHFNILWHLRPSVTGKSKEEVPMVFLSRHRLSRPCYVTQTFQLRTDAALSSHTHVWRCTSYARSIHPCGTTNWQDFVRICRPPTPSMLCGVTSSYRCLSHNDGVHICAS